MSGLNTSMDSRYCGSIIITSSFPAKLVNGAIAGMIGTCCVFPLDLAKTRLQNQRTVSKVGERVVKQYNNVFHCMYKVAQVEGFRGLYKGLLVNLLLVNPEKAIKLAVNDQARQYLGSSHGGFLPLHYEMLAGGFAGFCQVVITTPMEFLKIQMQIAGGSSASSLHRISATQVATKMIKEKGIRGVYKGYGATLMRDVPFSCIYFPLFAYLNSKGFASDGSRPPLVHTLICGLFAGMVSAGTVTPLDVIKTRLQVLKRAEGEATYNGFLDTATKIYKNEGIPAFFKGAVPRMVVVAPLFGIAQMIYFIGIAEKMFDIFS
ncbi:mitochondrial glutamate carrier 1 isoform X2 [Hydra vulgaris]|uniref:Mitochondrial glutamate carrier 1 isoform X2 n=1 Tax=Hydra vulgaris TaxID=6087 RepID=A0ABM4D3M8_HYDVU